MPRFRRVHKRLILFALGLPMVGLALCAGALYYAVHYRFADSLNYAVTRGSKGRFILETGEAGISLREGVIRIRNARFHCRDTANTTAWVDIRIPELYFSIGSWRRVIIQRKFMVDSLAILRPTINIHLIKDSTQTHRETVTATDLLNTLDSTLRHLQVRSFSLQDAAFTLTETGGADALNGKGDHIRLSVTNLTRPTEGYDHFFTANALSVSLGRQHWVKPKSGLNLDLARLAFDTRTQRFEVDSLSFTGHPDPTRPKFEFAADRLYFTGHDLKTIYRDGGLQLDSLVCVNPVVTLPATGKKVATDKGPVPSAFFNYIHIRLVHILNGRIKTRDAAGQAGMASTRKADLRIFGLRIDGAVTSTVMTDSIGVDLHHLEFLSKDGAHRLTIEEFGLNGNDAVFRQVRLAPTHPEPGNTVIFTSPELVIRDISIPDLLRNHLRASGAQLFSPTIDLTDTLQRKAPQPKMKLLYTTMHGVRELIDAPWLDIIDGTEHFKLGGTTPVELTATGLQAHILLNKLFLSDSLLDIKQALPIWKVADFELISEPFRLSAFGYELNGGNRHSICREAHLSLASGWHLDAKDVFWDALNWDRLQETGAFHIDSLNIDSLAIQHPAINNSIHVKTDGVRLLDLTVGAAGIRWRHAKAALHGLSFQRPNIDLNIGDGAWDSDSGLVLKDIKIDAAIAHGRLDWQLPVAKIRAIVHSTDWKTLPPLSLSVPQAAFLYAAINAGDTLRVDGQLKLTVNSGRIFPHLSGAVDLAFDRTSASRHTADAQISASGLTGSFHDANLGIDSANNTDWRSWLARTSLTQARLQYRTKRLTAGIQNCTWDPAGRTLQLESFVVSPALSREATFKQATWQNDYVTVRGHRLILAGIRFTGDPSHPSIEAPAMILAGTQVEASRDKHIPFHHGMEKAMPTKLLAALHFAVRVDTVHILAGKVTYNEWPVTSSRWTSLTIDDINGEIQNLHSRPDDPDTRTRPNGPDTLHLMASARLFDGSIRRFTYNESYGDSLSGFTARCSFSAFDLTQLSSILVPAASVSVVRGHVDTIWSAWRGNRYAAVGTMDLHYDRLKVSVLNKKDSARRSFLPVVETVAANLLLPNRNKRQSPIFFERDREKFVFNYWVKCQASGILSALVRSKDRTYEKRYAELAEKYHLMP